MVGTVAVIGISKTNQEGEVRAIRTLWATTSPEPADGVVPLSAQMIGLRFTGRSAGRFS